MQQDCDDMYINDEIKRLRLKVNREKVYDMIANLIAAKIHELPSVRKELRQFVFRQGELYVSLKSEGKKRQVQIEMKKRKRGAAPLNSKKGS